MSWAGNSLLALRMSLTLGVKGTSASAYSSTAVGTATIVQKRPSRTGRGIQANQPETRWNKAVKRAQKERKKVRIKEMK